MLNNVLDFNYLILSLKFEFDIELELGLLMNQAKPSQVKFLDFLMSSISNIVCRNGSSSNQT